MEQLLDTGLVSLEEAAAALGMTEKRLIGFMARNGIADPIGDGRLVYGWSCRHIADTSSGVVETAP